MTHEQKQFEVLRWASLFLEKHHRESRVAEILLQYYLGVDRQQFYMLVRDPARSGKSSPDRRWPVHPG